jgi:protein-tyrosine phosphatase
MTAPLKIVTLCTGNVARSVMLGYMFATIAEAYGEDWNVRTAGTHVTEGSAMSSRTREALTGIGELGEHRYGAHRSHQLVLDDVAWADVVIATEAGHVDFVRRSFAEHAAKSVQLHQFVRYAPLDATFVEQLAQVSSMEPEARFDVADPAGGDQAVYDACAQQLWELAQTFALLIRDDEPGQETAEESDS